MPRTSTDGEGGGRASGGASRAARSTRGHAVGLGISVYREDIELVDRLSATLCHNRSGVVRVAIRDLARKHLPPG